MWFVSFLPPEGGVPGRCPRQDKRQRQRRLKWKRNPTSPYLMILNLSESMSIHALPLP
jgi:hypothetical protein